MCPGGVAECMLPGCADLMSKTAWLGRAWMRPCPKTLKRLSNAVLCLALIGASGSSVSASTSTYPIQSVQATLASYPTRLVEALRQQVVAVAASSFERGDPAPASTGAPRGEGERILRVAVLSDMNGSYGSTTYREEVQRAVGMVTDELDVELVLSTGDMVAGMKPGLEYEKMWLAFHQAVTLPLTRAGLPFAVTPGNHDASAAVSYPDERVQYMKQWELWRPDLDFVDDRYYPRRYAFKHSGVLFISLDATTVGRLSVEQMEWLEALLEAHRDVKLKIAFGHLPLYPFAKRRVHEIIGDAKLEELFNEHGVEAYLSGHHHAYYPGKRDDLRLIGMSCLGGGPRALVGMESRSPRSVALLEIDLEAMELIDVNAHLTASEGVIERDDLPESLNRGGHKIWRDDIYPSLHVAAPAL